MPENIVRTVRIVPYTLTITADPRRITLAGAPPELVMTRIQAFRLVETLEFVATRAVRED